jgi:hypothetical protein
MGIKTDMVFHDTQEKCHETIANAATERSTYVHETKSDRDSDN